MTTERTVRRTALTALAGLALLLSSCAQQDLPPLADTPVFPYRLGPGDQVRIITFGEEQLTGQFRVNDAGTIAVPLLGTVPAGGRTVDQIQDEIAAALKEKKLIVSPSVSVEVIAFRPIFVLGEVVKPGEYPYQPGMTVLTAVAVAGGFTYRAVERHAKILRDEAGHAVEGTAARGAHVHPGDVVTIEERYF